MSRVETVSVEGISASSLSNEEKNALLILENLSIDRVDSLKKLLDLTSSAAIDLTTIQKFLQFCKTLDFDLSEKGVNAFKDKHKLGNTGVLMGVIGPQTAEFYFQAIISKAVPTSESGTSSGIRQINEVGLHLIEEFEGLARKLSDGRIAAYLDAVGVPTIGYGHTKNVHLGLVVTTAEAQQFLEDDLKQAEVAVAHLVKVNVNDNQFAALVSFVFNLGAGALASSSLLRYLNSGNYQAAADQFLRWTHAGGRVLEGLVRRRQAERALFLS